MTVVLEQQQAIDPDRLVIVTMKDPAQELVVIACRYVVALDAHGTRAVAMELTMDPALQTPRAAYVRALPQLRRLLVDPRRVERIRPYRG